MDSDSDIQQGAGPLIAGGRRSVLCLHRPHRRIRPALDRSGGRRRRAHARSRAEEVRAFLLKHGPGLGKRVNIASKGGLPDVRSGTAQVEIQLR